MGVQGGAIFTLLIKGLKEIDQQHVCIRHITPSSISLSDDLKRLRFKNIQNVCDKGKEEPC
jgi:hypothetical protein